MKKLRTLPMTLAEWDELKGITPIGTERDRAESLHEALRALAQFAGWKDSLQQLKRKRVEQGDHEWDLMEHLEGMCSRLRRDLAAEELMRRPRSETRRNLIRLATRLKEVLLITEQDWPTVQNLLWRFEKRDLTDYPVRDHREFRHALGSIQRIAAAATEAADSDLWKRERGHYIFLHDCRWTMIACRFRKVALTKTESPLLRFARPLYTYATGRRVAPGSFDRTLDQLAIDQPLDFLWAAMESRKRKSIIQH